MACAIMQCLVIYEAVEVAVTECIWKWLCIVRALTRAVLRCEISLTETLKETDPVATSSAIRVNVDVCYKCA